MSYKPPMPDPSPGVNQTAARGGTEPSPRPYQHYYRNTTQPKESAMAYRYQSSHRQQSSGLMNTTLSLLGGAAIGAGLMYLFDPEQGEDRRQTVGSSLGDAAGTAASRLGKLGATVGAGTAAAASSAASSTASGASSLWDVIAHKARDLADSIGEGASSAAHSTRKSASRASETAGGWFDSGWNRAKHVAGYGERDEWESDEDSTSPATAPAVGIGVLGVVALGTVAAYLIMDPDKRRTATESFKRAMTNAGRGARDLGTRLGGAVGMGTGAAGGPVRQTEYATSDDFMQPEVGRSMPGTEATSTGTTSTPESFRPQGM